MTYNPAVTDRSAEILTSANNQAAAIQLRGMENIGNSLASMGESAAKAYKEANENKITSDYLDAMAGQYSQIYRPDGKATYMDAETLKNFSKAPLGRKQGIITSLAAQQEFDNKQWIINTQMSRANAAYQNQVPANQQPVSMGANTAPAATNAGTQPFTIGSDIQTRPAYQQR